MREILFRGKDKGTGEWLQSMTISKHYYNDEEIFSYYIGAGYRTIDAKTLGQYTGLTDKNGTKIFEGDIVKLSYKDGFEIGLIGWSNIDVRYKFASPDGTAYGIDVTNTFEVIGNIHDNPELMKGGAE